LQDDIEISFSRIHDAIVIINELPESAQFMLRVILVDDVFVILIAILSSRIKERLWVEFESNVTENSVNKDIGTPTEKVYNVSVKDAWTQERFEKNDYFPGTALRVYRLRVFTEMLREDPILFTGYGLNATDFRIAQKDDEHNLYEGYHTKNFHNEYVQMQCCLKKLKRAL
jgi:hypothetical protein